MLVVFLSFLVFRSCLIFQIKMFFKCFWIREDKDLWSCYYIQFFFFMYKNYCYWFSIVLVIIQDNCVV